MERMIQSLIADFVILTCNHQWELDPEYQDRRWIIDTGLSHQVEDSELLTGCENEN